MGTLFNEYREIHPLSAEEYCKLLWDLDMANKHLAFCGKYAEAFHTAMTDHYGSVFCRLKMMDVKPELPDFLDNELFRMYEDLFTLFAENASGKKIKQYVDGCKASDLANCVRFFASLIKYSEPFGDYLYFPVETAKKIIDKLGCRLCITNEIAAVLEKSNRKLKSIFLVENTEQSKIKAIFDSLVVLNYNVEPFIVVDQLSDKSEKEYVGFDFAFDIEDKNSERQNNQISVLLESLKNSCDTVDAMLFINGLDDKGRRIEVSWYIPLKSLKKHLKSAPSIAGLKRFFAEYGIKIADDKAAVELSRLFVNLRLFARTPSDYDQSSKQDFIIKLKKQLKIKNLKQYELDDDIEKDLESSIKKIIEIMEKVSINMTEYKTINNIADHWHNLSVSIKTQFKFAPETRTIKELLSSC